MQQVRFPLSLPRVSLQSWYLGQRLAAHITNPNDVIPFELLVIKAEIYLALTRMPAVPSWLRFPGEMWSLPGSGEI